MLLKKAHVTHFRSVEDLGLFQVGQVTSLIGKNELERARSFSPLQHSIHIQAPLRSSIRNVTYPRRHLTAYAERHNEEGGQACAINTFWELEDEELAAIEQSLGKDVLISNAVQIWRRYQAEPGWEVDIDNEKAVSNLCRKPGLHRNTARIRFVQQRILAIWRLR